MTVTVNTKKFDSEVTDAIMDLADHSFEREQKTFARQYNPEQMARDVETLLKRPHAGDPIRHWNPKAVATLFKEIAELQTLAIRDPDPNGMNRYYEMRKLTQSIMDYSDTLRKSRPKTWDEAKAEAQGNIDRILKGTHKNAMHVATQVEAATHRCPFWSTQPLVVVPHFNKNQHWDIATSFSVKVGTHGADFTVFTKPDGTIDQVDDVLEGGDDDFFRDFTTQTDYLNLVKELRSPGSSSKGKPVRLWTARPVKDRKLYEHAHTVPPNIFLTNDPDRALGLSTDLGSAARDVWHVIINSKYLVETWDGGRIKDYQVVGDRPVPVDRIELYMEAATGRIASRYVVRCAGLDPWRHLHKKPLKEFPLGDNHLVKIYDDEIYLLGSTFSIRGDLAKLGFKWDGYRHSLETSKWPAVETRVKTLVTQTSRA